MYCTEGRRPRGWGTATPLTRCTRPPLAPLRQPCSWRPVAAVSLAAGPGDAWPRTALGPACAGPTWLPGCRGTGLPVSRPAGPGPRGSPARSARLRAGEPASPAPVGAPRRRFPVAAAERTHRSLAAAPGRVRPGMRGALPRAADGSWQRSAEALPDDPRSRGVPVAVVPGPLSARRALLDLPSRSSIPGGADRSVAIPHTEAAEARAGAHQLLRVAQPSGSRRGTRSSGGWAGRIRWIDPRPA